MTQTVYAYIGNRSPITTWTKTDVSTSRTGTLPTTGVARPDADAVGAAATEAGVSGGQDGRAYQVKELGARGSVEKR